MNEFEEQLSPQGLRRREQILLASKREARRRRHKRRAAPIAGVLLLMCMSALILRRDEPSPKALVMQPDVIVEQPLKIQRIQDDPTIVERLAVEEPIPRWQTIGDDELLQALADAGQRGGLIATDGGTVLVTD